jgi:putative addiction module killer protein
MPPVERIAVELFQTADGHCPYREWFDSLRDGVMRDRIDVRLARLRLGNPGDHRELGDGLWELRLFFGPGLRVYFTWRGKRVVILLAGGTKGTQRQDIRKARAYLKELREREP